MFLAVQALAQLGFRVSVERAVATNAGVPQVEVRVTGGPAESDHAVSTDPGAALVEACAKIGAKFAR